MNSSILIPRFRVIGLVCLILAVGCRPQRKKEIVQKRPNFLVVIADDAGWNDVGYHGSEINTPVLDSLAHTGIRLERFYVAPTCSPSRAALLTGRPASRMGIVAPISGKSELALPKEGVTLPQALDAAGYQTALFGKWHLGLRPENGPSAYGFDYSYGFLHGQIDQYTHEYKNGDPSWHRNGTFLDENGHVTDLLTADIISWLTSRRDTARPFYAQLAYSAPHFPLQEPEKWKRPYQAIEKDSSRVDFAAAMTHMDSDLGKVFHTLDKLRLSENTVVLFISDNGAMESWYPKDQYGGRFGPDSVLGNNTPLRDWKTTNYEGAIRVPAILAWKDHLSPGVDQTYISAIDVMPTFLHLAGQDSLPSGVEGMDFWQPVTTGTELQERPIYIRGHLQESVIMGPWKLIRTRYVKVPPKYELYHLDIDPEEKNDLIDVETERANIMKKAMDKEFARDAVEVNDPRIREEDSL